MPLQLPEYQLYDAPVPSVPPISVNVVAPPQVGLRLAVADVGATDGALTVTVTGTQAVVLQVPWALT